MEEVDVEPVSLDRLTAILPPDRASRLEASAVRARASFGDRVVWHVNSTASGGGVAEMLQTLLAYGKDGIENRWLVLDGDAEFFRITKRCTTCCTGRRVTAALSARLSTTTIARCWPQTSSSSNTGLSGRHRADP